MKKYLSLLEGLNLAKPFNIQLKIHYSVFAILATSIYFWGVAWSLSIFLTLFFSVVAHEYGHALVAKKFGYKVVQIIFTPIGGMASIENFFENPKHEFWIAIAGPAVSIALFFLSGLTLFYLSDTTLLYDWIKTFCILNGVLTLFNILPVFPLDGGRIFRSLLHMKFPLLKATKIAAFIGFFGNICFLTLGLTNLNVSLVLISIYLMFATIKELEFVKNYMDVIKVHNTIKLVDRHSSVFNVTGKSFLKKINDLSKALKS